MQAKCLKCGYVDVERLFRVLLLSGNTAWRVGYVGQQDIRYLCEKVVRVVKAWLRPKPLLDGRIGVLRDLGKVE